MLKITAYADRLINDLDDVDYIDRVKTQQRNWIGRSHGAEINFDTTAGDTLTVYTTRADTLFGATYMVISPEHAFIKKVGRRGPYPERRRRRRLSGGGRPQVRLRAHRAEQGKRPALSSRASRASTPSTARRSPSLSPTTSWQPTAPAPSWPCPPTTPATGSLPKVRPAHHRGRQGHCAQRPRQGGLHRRGHRHARQLRLPERPVR